MARILCSISGIEFKTDHFPVYLTAREYHHPVFSISTSELLTFADKWIDGQFSATEDYLYYLALFNSTKLVEFRVPAIRTNSTQSIIAQNTSALLSVVERIHVAGEDKVRYTLNLPMFAITSETKDLSNTMHWIKLWENNYNDYLKGYKTSTLIEKLSRKETILERLLKDRTKDISSYANQLAEWAALASGFDSDTQIVADGTAGDKPIQLCEYWKKLIRMCARDEAIYTIHDGDLSELIDFCEDTIPHGSIQAHALMALLRSSKEKKDTYIDLGDIDIGAHGTIFRILDASSSIEDANKLALIDSAPLHLPKMSEYPNKLAYLKAKMKWDMAESYRKSEEARSKIDESAKLLESVLMKRRSGDVI